MERLPYRRPHDLPENLWYLFLLMFSKENCWSKFFSSQRCVPSSSEMRGISGYPEDIYSQFPSGSYSLDYKWKLSLNCQCSIFQQHEILSNRNWRWIKQRCSLRIIPIVKQRCSAWTSLHPNSRLRETETSWFSKCPCVPCYGKSQWLNKLTNAVSICNELTVQHSRAGLWRIHVHFGG